jgi:hypothetical protein
MIGLAAPVGEPILMRANLILIEVYQIRFEEATPEV